MAKGPLLQKAWDRLPEDRKQAIQAEANEKIESYQKSLDLRRQITQLCLITSAAITLFLIYLQIY